MGFILLWREMLEKELFREKPYCPLGAWVWILMNANFEDKPDRFGELVRRGEMHTSQPALASAWGWSRSKVQRFLDRLEAEQRIEQQTNNKRTKIRTTNYELYQQASSVFEQQANKKPNKKPNSKVGTTETSINKETNSLSLLENARDSICSEFGVDAFEHYLPFISDWLVNSKKKYKDHSAFMRNWIRRDRDEEKGFFRKRQDRLPPKDFMTQRKEREADAVEIAKRQHEAEQAYLNKPTTKRLEA